ncbi:MAG: hypothetical protein QM758_26815 [Armatimonas sp.]
MQKPSATMPIAIAVLAIVGIIFANVMAGKNTPKTEAQMEQEAQEASAKNSSPGASPAAAASPGAEPVAMRHSEGGEYPPNVDLKDGNNLAIMGTDTTLPGTKSTETVTVGFEWTPEIQADPSALTKILDKVKAAAPEAQVRLMNVDENPTAPRGISINSKVIAPLGADGNLNEAAADAAIAEIKKVK